MILRFRLTVMILALLCEIGLLSVQGMTAASNDSNAIKPNGRPCEAPRPRTYKPKYQGLGYEILDSESEACFVPDQEYRVLDEIVHDVLAQNRYDATFKSRADQREQAERISRNISNTMAKHGFELYVDTETLSDALLDMGQTGGVEHHIYDCDTGSFIFVTVAENLKAAVAMVEIPIADSEMEHNYVRWLVGDESLFEWDMNRESSRSTPQGLTGNYGKSMSREATLGYARALRAKLWKRQKLYDRAISDYLASMKSYPGLYARNSFAWLVATQEVSNRPVLQKKALAAANEVVASYPTPNFKDTLACIYALGGDFQRAIEIETDVAQTSRTTAFRERLTLFRSDKPKDCTGQQ
jgi:hypothetical protein